MDEDPNLFCFLLSFRCKSPAAEGLQLAKLNIWVFSARRNATVGLKGKQVQILNDPVTVNGETSRKMSLCFVHEKARPESMIRKSGSLLKIEVHSFRRKRFVITYCGRFLFVKTSAFSEERAGVFCCPEFNC